MDESNSTSTPGQAQPPRARPLLFIGLFMVAFGLISYAPTLRAWLGLTPDLPEHLRDRQAPAFAATTLADRSLHFPDDFAGQLVLLDFWATWCGPCVAEIPHLRAAARRFADQPVRIISINVDGGGGGSPGVVEFIKARQMSWTHIVANTDAIARQYNVVSIPTLFLIDGDTREIVAAGEQLRGEYLEVTLATQVARKREEG